MLASDLGTGRSLGGGRWAEPGPKWEKKTSSFGFGLTAMLKFGWGRVPESEGPLPPGGGADIAAPGSEIPLEPPPIQRGCVKRVLCSLVHQREQSLCMDYFTPSLSPSTALPPLSFFCFLID